MLSDFGSRKNQNDDCFRVTKKAAPDPKYAVHYARRPGPLTIWPGVAPV